MKPHTKTTRLLPAAAIGIALLTCGAAANAQVVISEFLSDANTNVTPPSVEYIEIYNSGSTAVDIGGYTISDEESFTPDPGTEGAFSFPAGTMIDSGEVIITTTEATVFTTFVASLPVGTFPAGTQVFEWTTPDPDPNPNDNLIKNETLATGNIALSNGGDEILLFDASNTVIDAISYGGNTFAPFPTLSGDPDKGTAAIRQTLTNPPPVDGSDWMLNEAPTPGTVPFAAPNATCADDPCDANEDCDDTSGDIVCSCSAGFVEDALGVCIESCTTAACTLAGQVCNATTELCECDAGTTDYGNGACISPATITCDEDNLGYGFLGQAGDDTIPNGGCLTDDLADLDDAGLGAVLTAIADGDTDLATPIVVTGAVIAGTDAAGGKRQFYIQDSNGTLGTFLNGSAQPPFDLRVGQKVSFSVTKVGVFNSNPQISGATNWAVLSDGNFVAAPTATTALGEADAASIVHLVGVAAESRGDDGPCNDGECYRVESEDGISIIVRAADADITLGSRVEVVAPLEFRGDLSALLVNTLSNGFWADIQDPECTIDTDCDGADETCVNFACQGPAPTDECDDTTTPCTETGEICDTVASPTVCVCDEDNLFVDDGNGVCVAVECVGNVDCIGDNQVCASNVCACDDGFEDVSTTGDLDCQAIVTPTCGDGTCDAGEDATSCPADCDTTTGPTCGDGTCDSGEDATSCPADCETPIDPFCGNDVCEVDEDATSCPADCDATAGPTCGDDVCESGETASSCPADCDGGNPSGSVCGDGVVSGDEQCDGGPRCSDTCEEAIVVGGGGGGDCSSTSGGAGFPASLLIALGMIVGVTRRRKLS